jgi:hypothetical protein
MSVSRVYVMLFLLSFVHPRSARAQQTIPDNVDAGVFSGDILALLHASDTFRAQCERIAADPRIRVRLSIVSAIDGGGRAQTTFRRYRTGAVIAQVDVRFGANYRELLAHEFEHVIEQIDGIDLRREAAAGRAWEVADGTFETRRASLAGVQVLREADAPRTRPAIVSAATR